MSMEKDQVDRLIEAISSLRTIPPEKDLWDGDTVAGYLKLSKAHVMSRIVCLPGFPQTIRLPAAAGGKGHPRWKAGQVMEWAESFQECRSV